MAYVVQADLLLRMTAQELQQLTDDDRSGSVDTDTVNGVLAEASAMVDSYCRSRYTVPLQLSTDVTRIARDVAVYLLYSRRPQKMQETVRQRYEDAMALLKDVSSGKASLDQPEAATAAQTSADSGQLPSCNDQRMTDCNLQGFV